MSKSEDREKALDTFADFVYGQIREAMDGWALGALSPRDKSKIANAGTDEIVRKAIERLDAKP